MHARTWIFDLDNTLHDARAHVFPHIDRSMTAYLQASLGLDEAQAGDLRRHYWQRYGATLLGLMRHHGTDPDHFLRETHRVPDLERLVRKEPGLRSSLKRLRGRRVVFSNAPVQYARTVLKALKIADRVYLMERGRIALSGSGESLLNTPEVQRTYLGQRAA
jgi:putative hydrolase of the HAD superfamily